MSLHHVGGDRWKVVVYVGRDHFGRPRQRSHTFRAAGERAAKRAAAKHEATLRDEINDAATTRGTVAGLVDEWVAHHAAKDSPSTVRGNRSIVANIRRDLGRIQLDQLTARQLDRWYGELEARGMTGSTVANHHKILRAVVRQGWRWGECPVSTVDAVGRSQPPKAHRRRGRPPTTAALVLLLADAPPALGLAAHLAAATGMRRGEILALRWSDITGASIRVRRNLIEVGKADGRFTLGPTKTGEERTLTIDPSTVARLEQQHQTAVERATFAQVELDPDGYVLSTDPTGKTPRRPGWLTQAWRRHCARMGATGVRLHDLRHWHATELIDAGHSVATVQRRLGHAKPTTTLAVYTSAVDASDVRAAADIGKRLGSSQ